MFIHRYHYLIVFIFSQFFYYPPTLYLYLLIFLHFFHVYNVISIFHQIMHQSQLSTNLLIRSSSYHQYLFISIVVYLKINNQNRLLKNLAYSFEYSYCELDYLSYPWFYYNLKFYLHLYLKQIILFFMYLVYLYLLYF